MDKTEQQNIEFILDTLPMIVIERCMNGGGCSYEEALQKNRNLIERFVAHVELGEPVTSHGTPIDDTWHNFILRTQIYEPWCMKTFGRMIHHPHEKQSQRELLTNTVSQSL